MKSISLKVQVLKPALLVLDSKRWIQQTIHLLNIYESQKY